MAISWGGHLAARGPAVAGCLALGAYWSPALAAVLAPVHPAVGVLARLTDERTVALTFDDGPHQQATRAVLDLLAGARVPATFFLVGEQVERMPALAREIAAAGHEIALHCHRHRCLLRLPPDQVREDLVRATVAIADATDHVPRLYRPPYGLLNGAALAFARRRGWRTVLWSRDARDWARGQGAPAIADRLTRRLRGGDVVLLHDADHYSAPGSWRRTVAALPALLEELDRRKLRAVRIPVPGAR